jgi:transposase InsO family protein
VLDTAARRRRPPRGLIFHSDRGSEYVAAAFRERVAALGMRQSSALREPEATHTSSRSFHSLKAEVVHGVGFVTEDALRHELGHYMRYYNRRRLHSALGYQSPVDDESRAT